MATGSALSPRLQPGNTSSPSRTISSGLSIDSSDWVILEDGVVSQGDADGQLALKKRVWQMRVCQRKLATTIHNQLKEESGLEVDVATVEALSGELELLRASLGEHWTWFEEELFAGRYDSQLLGKTSGKLAFPLLPASVDSFDGAAPTAGYKHAKRWSPTASAKSTPKLKPQKSPPSSPVVKKQMPPQEVWLAAARHRKSNFFGAAVLGSSAGAPDALFAILQFGQVEEALSLGITSSGFAAELFGFSNLGFVEVRLTPNDQDDMTSALWKLLGLRFLSKTAEGQTTVLLPFADDPAFKPQVWARLHAFAAKVSQGEVRPSVIAPAAAELGCASVSLGPFLASSSMVLDQQQESEGSRLLVGDGQQMARIVDVARRKEEDVEIDRYCNKQKLFSSLGTHPAEVTSSWLMEEGRHCTVRGGLVVARPTNTKAPTGQDSEKAVVCQWLELPDFDRIGPRPEEQGQSIPTQSKSAPTSPAFLPATAPGKSGAARKLSNPSRNSKAVAPAPPPLVRLSLLQEQISAAICQVSGEAPPAVISIHAMWPLPEHRVLLMVCDQVSTSQGAPKGSRMWLQIWEVPCDIRSKDASLVPLLSFRIDSTLTCTHSIASGGRHLLLSGFCNGRTELRQLPGRDSSEAPLLASWTSESPVKHVLLLPANSEANCSTLVPVASYATGVKTGTWTTASTSKTLSSLLPNETVSSSLEVIDMQKVGDCGFAVCSKRHVYAFEATLPLPVLVAVVELPMAPVLQFLPTLYKFFVVFGTAQRSAICCMWPVAGEAKDTRTETSSAYLQAWSATSSDGDVKQTRLVESVACCVDLDRVLVRQKAPINALALNWPHSYAPGCGLLAVSTVGPGVAVFRWGTEVNPSIEKVRSIRDQHKKEQSRQQQQESKHRQLQRLQQRLQETEKLEARARESGMESLSEQEQSKLQRREQVESDIEQLKQELGLDVDEGKGDQGDKQVDQEEAAEVAARNRREKEKAQVRHKAEKRAMQNERRQNRERKLLA
eukprot:TRINITY_DN18410_c0_g1_i1.p1 TRINITY_DN18410_c0_g1~~TRINITY_DN18410_c0_g1_i1.p1  ORF type:complete len:1016 (+),score=208.81 TRINITY_DN18410_c0_g1_i1:35-3049(+)